MDRIGIERACIDACWRQVAGNGGPPCFHMEAHGRFCFRAERWDGHGLWRCHAFVPLVEFYRSVAAPRANRGDGNVWIDDLRGAFNHDQGRAARGGSAFSVTRTISEARLISKSREW
jgi:hypothetical protein